MSYDRSDIVYKLATHEDLRQEIKQLENTLTYKFIFIGFLLGAYFMFLFALCTGHIH